MNLGEKIESVGQLVRAGYEPGAALHLVGLPTVKHIGLPPVTVQPADRGTDAAPAPGVGEAE